MADVARRRPLDWLRRRTPPHKNESIRYRNAADVHAHAPSRLVLRPGPVLAISDFLLLAMFNAALLLSIQGRLDVLSLSEMGCIIVAVVSLNTVFLYAMGCFRKDAIVSKPDAMSRLPVVVGLASIGLFALLHFGFPILFQHDRVYLSISRCVLLAFVSVGGSLAALIASRYIFFAMMHRQWFRRRILIVGGGERAAHLSSMMMREPYRSHMQIMTIENDMLAYDCGASTPSKLDVSGRNFEALAMEIGIDEIVVAAEHGQPLPIESLLACKVNGVPITTYQGFMERETGRVDLRFIDPSYLVFSQGFQVRVLDRIAKRVLDIVLSLVLLAVCLPIFAVACLAIWVEGGGAIFYRQERLTRGNRVFWLYKLRTMRPDAEKDGARWAAKADDRITRVGKFLRRTRIDEIPQILNILKGDMSLVGPRPERPLLVDEIGKEVHMFALRHGVKTGLTGWAQINYPYGASIEDAARKLEYDLYYMKNYSWLRDISIILQTIRIIIWQEGAR
ncbi:MAG: TIGR03013 family XrtA/PEP-CTERM system glycosyltransferase [Rhizomicrobium sp.]